MKGIVFTEFIEMVETNFGDDMLDNIIEASNLPNNGAYTAIGTYPYSELITLVVQLSKRTKIAVGDLVFAFGKYLFNTFTKAYGGFFKGEDDIFNFLSKIDNYIHIEVRKLYPDAELPKFTCQKEGTSRLIMDYESERAMSDLAHGLITQCSAYFKQPLNIQIKDLSNGNGTFVRFTLDKI